MIFFRTLPTLIVLALLALTAVVFMVDAELYYGARHAVGLKRFAPFLDLHGVQAAIECHQRGIDVYSENPCDELGRLHGYSPLWLRLPGWLAAPGLLGPLGLGCGVLFAAALLLLPAVAGWRAGLAMVLGAVSPVGFFALERANVDVPIFAAVALGAVLLGGGGVARGIGHALGLAGGLMKFYPLALLALLAREGWRRGLVLGGAAAAIGLAALWPLRAELGPALANVPGLPAFSSTFGARMLARDLAALMPGLAALAGAATLLAAGVAAALAVAVARRTPPGLPAPHQRMLRSGGLVVVACFLAGESVEYRAIFLLMTLPALLWLAGRHRGFGLTALAVLWLLWDPLLRRVLARLWPGEGALPSWPGVAAWGLRELLWWGVVAVLAGLVAAHWRVDTPPRAVSMVPRTEGGAWR